ncbi:MAG: hypothetical protein PHV43_01220 [Candidatus Colwellbacteria bacterium]|nr:hypothetical protein [Candidatus Colwellbacteria bacterium]
MSLRDISTDELEAELHRRSLERIEAEKPVAVESPDFTAVIKACREFIDNPHEGKPHSATYLGRAFGVYREAMRVIYGDAVFDWLLKQMDR